MGVCHDARLSATPVCNVCNARLQLNINLVGLVQEWQHPETAAWLGLEADSYEMSVIDTLGHWGESPHETRRSRFGKANGWPSSKRR